MRDLMVFQPSSSFPRPATTCIFRRCLKTIFLVVVTVCTSQLTSVSARADTFSEIGDAGQTMGTYQVVPSGVNSIYGKLGFDYDIDMYALRFGTSANVNVTIEIPGSNWFDTDVTIFDVQGHPLYVFDDSIFSFHVEPGTYLFALADWNVYAANASGTIIADDYGDVLDPNGVFDHFVDNTSPYRIGGYQIDFSVATVPEPSSLAMAVGGLAISGIAVLGRQRRRQAR